MALSWEEADANGTLFPDVAHETGPSEGRMGVDLSDSPNFIRVTLTGEWPSSDQQRQLQQSLSETGKLTADTRTLIDLRDLASLGPVDPVAAVKDGLITRIQAYLVATSEQHHFARQCRIAAGPGRVLEIFIEERAALEWLWNASPDY